MCIIPKTPALPAMREAPNRTSASVANASFNAQRSAAASGGVFSNIFTSPGGDSGYNKSTGRAAPATATL